LFDVTSITLTVRVCATQVKFGMTLRVLIAFFSGVIALITTVLIPFAHFGDKNETWTRRLIAIAFAASIIFPVAWFW
jgi:hypothetical protein